MLVSSPLPSGVININWNSNHFLSTPAWMIVYGVLGFLELLFSAIGLWMECTNPRPIATGCTLCEVISSILGLLTICDLVVGYLIFPYYSVSLNCSATTHNPLCQDSYRSVYLLPFALVILVYNVLVCMHRIVL